MESFRYSTNSQEFIGNIEEAIKKLPTIGDPMPNKIIYLAHYSKNDRIDSFEKCVKFGWTHRVSDSPHMIGKSIGYFDIDFSSLYLIKLGIGTSYKPRNYNCGFTDEYVVDRLIRASEFIRLSLILMISAICIRLSN